MKHYLILFIGVFVLLLPAKPQEVINNDDRKHCIKINLLSPVVSALNLAFETQIAKEYSFQLGAVYMNHPAYGTTDGVTKAFFITPEFRYELTNTRNGYAFIGVFTRYINMDYSRSEKHPGGVISRSSAKYESLGLGVLIGQKIIYRNKIVFEFFAGPVYAGLLSAKNDFYYRKQDEIILDQDIPDTLLRRYGIRAGFTIGWMF